VVPAQNDADGGGGDGDGDDEPTTTTPHSHQQANTHRDQISHSVDTPVTLMNFYGVVLIYMDL